MLILEICVIFSKNQKNKLVDKYCKIALTIGKYYRLHAGLDRKEMVAEVMSQSFHSKVESGMHNIDAEQLTELLNNFALVVDILKKGKYISLIQDSLEDE